MAAFLTGDFLAAATLLAGVLAAALDGVLAAGLAADLAGAPLAALDEAFVAAGFFTGVLAEDFRVELLDAVDLAGALADDVLPAAFAGGFTAGAFLTGDFLAVADDFPGALTVVFPETFLAAAADLAVVLADFVGAFLAGVFGAAPPDAAGFLATAGFLAGVFAADFAVGDFFAAVVFLAATDRAAFFAGAALRAAFAGAGLAAAWAAGFRVGVLRAGVLDPVPGLAAVFRVAGRRAAAAFLTPVFPAALADAGAEPGGEETREGVRVAILPPIVTSSAGYRRVVGFSPGPG